MGLRCYATNSYPALSGQYHTHLNAFQDMTRDFVIQYERFPEHKYTLIWPEFADPRKLLNQGTWERFGELRTFLVQWAGHKGVAPQINTAYKKFLERPHKEKKGLPLPAGFVLDRSRVACMPAPPNDAQKFSRTAEGLIRSQGRRRREGKPKIDKYRPRKRESSRHQPGS